MADADSLPVVLDTSSPMPVTLTPAAGYPAAPPPLVVRCGFVPAYTVEQRVTWLDDPVAPPPGKLLRVTPIAAPRYR